MVCRASLTAKSVDVKEGSSQIVPLSKLIIDVSGWHLFISH
jgi:hypothetical protein